MWQVGALMPVDLGDPSRVSALRSGSLARASDTVSFTSPFARYVHDSPCCDARNEDCLPTVSALGSSSLASLAPAISPSPGLSSVFEVLRGEIEHLQPSWADS